MKQLVNSFNGYILGPYKKLWKDEQKKVKDPNNFVMVLSLVFSIAFFIIFRGLDQFFADLGSTFASLFSTGLVFFILLVLMVGLTIFNYIYLEKKKGILCLFDSLFSILFIFYLYFIIHVSVSYGINDKNWLLWLIMILPSFVFLFTLLVRFIRMISHYFEIERNLTEARSHDLLMKQHYQKRMLTHLKIYFKENWGQVLVVIALICLAIAVLYPLLLLVIRSIKEANFDLTYPFDMPTKFTFDNYAFAWEYVKNAFLNSIITTIGVTVGTMICASLLAFAVIRFKFPGKSIIFYAIIGLMMIPGILTLISRFQLVQQLGLISDGYYDFMDRMKVYGGIILPGIAGYIPMAFMLLFTFFNSLPKDLFEAADVDGANDFSVFMKIVVPLSKPILSTIAIQTFVGEWNDYLWANLVKGSFDDASNLPVMLQSMSALAEQGGIAWTAVWAGYVLSAIPLILIFIVASKQFVEGLTSGAFKM